MSGNAETVFEALRRRVRNGITSAPIQQLASDTGLGERTARRALSELVRNGYLVPVGRNGRTTLFRISDEQRPAEVVQCPTPRNLGGHLDKPDICHAAAHLSAASDEDTIELTDEAKAAYAVLARDLADRYSGHVQWKPPLPDWAVWQDARA